MTSEYIGSHPKTFYFLLCFASLSAIGFLDYLTGDEISVSVFYLVPVSLAAWQGTKWMGILFCFLSAMVWFLADVMTGHVYSHLIIPYWNAIVRLSFFLVVAELLTRLKLSLAREKMLSATDSLTGLLNVRAFYDLANKEIDRARRFKRPFTLGYIDLDDFKMVNDQLGHSVGDVLLRSVADIIKKNTRTINLSARLGGDEFAILLAETGIESAHTVFSRLQGKIMEDMRRNKWPVTLSIGAITFSKPPDAVDDMVRKADNLMYKAKNSGKNKILLELLDE
jgi:diguanylate cyclase (GGDEF)-like protein